MIFNSYSNVYFCYRIFYFYFQNYLLLLLHVSIIFIASFYSKYLFVEPNHIFCFFTVLFCALCIISVSSKKNKNKKLIFRCGTAAMWLETGFPYSIIWIGCFARWYLSPERNFISCLQIIILVAHLGSCYKQLLTKRPSVVLPFKVQTFTSSNGPPYVIPSSTMTGG